MVLSPESNWEEADVTMVPNYRYASVFSTTLVHNVTLFWSIIFCCFCPPTGRRWNSACEKDWRWMVHWPTGRSARNVSCQVCGNHWGSSSRNGARNPGIVLQKCSILTEQFTFKQELVYRDIAPLWNNCNFRSKACLRELTEAAVFVIQS